MPGQPFSIANLREAADALYGRRQWQPALARDLNTTQRTIRGWFDGQPLPDLRQQLVALLTAVGNKNLALMIAKLGPPER